MKTGDRVLVDNDELDFTGTIINVFYNSGVALVQSDKTGAVYKILLSDIREIEQEKIGISREEFETRCREAITDDQIKKELFSIKGEEPAPHVVSLIGGSFEIFIDMLIHEFYE